MTLFTIWTITFLGIACCLILGWLDAKKSKKRGKRVRVVYKSRKRKKDEIACYFVIILLGAGLASWIISNIVEKFQTLPWWFWLIISILLIVLLVLLMRKKDKVNEEKMSGVSDTLNEYEQKIRENNVKDVSCKKNCCRRWGDNSVNTYSKNVLYHKKSLLTEIEQKFYLKLQQVIGDKYLLQTQVNLASVVNKEAFGYQNELFRNIDFGIFDKKTFACILLIELNDKTHLTRERMERDDKVRGILDDAGIPLLVFWTNEIKEIDDRAGRISKYINL